MIKRLHTFFADDIHRNWHIILPADCSPSMMRALKRSDIQHGLRLEGQTVATKRTRFLYTDVYS